MAENREDDAPEARTDTENNDGDTLEAREETLDMDAAETGSEDPEAPADEASDDAEETAEDTRDGDENEAENPLEKRVARGTSKSSSGPTAGQRLAATMAAKSAKKAAKRGKDAITTEAAAEARAEELAGWMKNHGKGVWIGLGAALLIVGGVLGWTIWRTSTVEKAGRALSDAVKVASAPIDPEGNDGSAVETFPSVQARSEKTLAMFRRVLKDHAGTDAARWARLGEATSLLSLGLNDQAKAAYEHARREAGEDHAIAARAIEGLAFTDEVAGRWAEATRQYEALSRLHDGAYKDLAEYHLGRVYLAQGNTDRAKTTWKALLDRLAANREKDSHQAAPYAQNQAELRLAQIDPSLVPRSLGNTLGDPSQMQFQVPGQGDISQEELQRLIEQIQKKRQGGP